MLFDKNISMSEIRALSERAAKLLFSEFVAIGPPIPTKDRQCCNSEKSQPNDVPHSETTSKTKLGNTEQSISNDLEFVRPFLGVWLNLANPLLTMSELLAKAEVKSGSKQFRIKKTLLRHGLIREHQLQGGKSYFCVPEPTSKAYESINLEPRHFKSKGGYIHAAMAKRICEWAKRNECRAAIEHVLPGGKALDILLRQGSKDYAIEIVNSLPLQKEYSNFIQNLSSGVEFEHMVFVVKDSKTGKALGTLFQDEFSSSSHKKKLKIVLAGEFFARDSQRLRELIQLEGG